MLKDRLRELRERHGYTKRQLGDYLKITPEGYGYYESGKRKPNPNTLHALADFYHVTVDYLLARSDDPTPYKPDLSELPSNILPIQRKKIPLIGTIAAGEPILANEEFEQYVVVGTDVRADYALRIKGDSMINARIMDGDIIFIREQPTVDNGEIAAVLIDDEATLKRVYINGDTVTLVAENPKYSPRTIRIDEFNSQGVRILGKAVAFQSDVY